MAKTYENKKLGAMEIIKDTYTKINDNSDAVNTDLTEVYSLLGGVSNVENYGVATKEEAEAGTAHNKYMTPLRTAEAITALGGEGGGETYETFTTEEDGLVPASGENTNKYLKGDGTWATPDGVGGGETFTTEEDGLVPASGENTNKYLKGDGTWATPDGVGGDISTDDVSDDSEYGLDNLTTTLNVIKNSITGVEHADVMAFGAVGDGVNDDSDAIQAAIEYVRKKGGGRVFFPMPPNFYRVEKTITFHIFFKNNSEIAGFHETLEALLATTGSTVGEIRCHGGSTNWSRGDWYEWDGSEWVSEGRYQISSGPSGNRIVLKDYSGIALIGESLGISRTLKGVRIRGMNIPADSDGHRHLISVKGMDGSPGEGIPNYPIDAFFIEHLAFRGVYNDDAVGNGYDVGEPYGAALYLDTIEQLAMINCRVDATNGPAVWIENSLDCCFTNMLVEECTVGFYISRGNHTHIHNITTCINRGAGMIITDDGLSPFQSGGRVYGTHGLIVTGCNIRNNNRDNVDNSLALSRRKANGIYMENAHNCVITGNHFSDDYAGDYVTETWGIQMQREGIYMEEEDLTINVPVAGTATTREHLTRASTNNVISGNYLAGNRDKANGGVIAKGYGTTVGTNALVSEEYVTVGVNPANWSSGVSFTVGQYTNRFELIYRCILNHTSGPDNIPGSGAQWATYWVLIATQPRFSTIQEAIDYFAAKTTTRKDKLTVPGWIGILPEYIINERVRVSGSNLGHVSIIHINQYGFTPTYRIIHRSGALSVDSNPDSWKTLGEGEYLPFLIGDKGAILPSLHTTIICRDTGYNNESLGAVANFDYRLTGVFLTEGSKMTIHIGGSGDPMYPIKFGFQGFDGAGARVSSGSYLNAPLADFSKNGIGIDVINARVNCMAAVIAECGVNNIGRTGLPMPGTYPFQGIACRALAGATVEATGANLTAATYQGVAVTQLSNVILNSANTRKLPGVGNQLEDLVVYGGGMASAFDMIGGTNITPNTISSSGIIFRNV